MKKFLSLALCFAMLTTMFSMLNVKAQEIDEVVNTVETGSKEIAGEYVEGEAIVKLKNNGTYFREENSISANSLLGNDVEYSIEKTWSFGNSSKNTGFLSNILSLDNSSYQSGKGNIALVKFDTLSTEEVIEKLESRPNIEYAEPNYINSISSDEMGSRAELDNINLLSSEMTSKPNDSYFGEQWGLNNLEQFGGKSGVDINVDAIWSQGVTGNTEQVIAVIDTGVDYTHPDLVNNMWVNETGVLPGTHGYDFVNDDDDPMDDNSHGTHCAGIIAAQGNNAIGVSGVNQSAKIMALKVGDANGNLANSSILSAYEYMIEAKKNGVDIIAANDSWGGCGPSKSQFDAVNIAGKLGILSICAAGNDSLDNDINQREPSAFTSPYVISVGALKYDGNVASFSNYGYSSVDVFAPGENILSTIPTSMNQYLPNLVNSNVIYENFDDETSDKGLEFSLAVNNEENNLEKTSEQYFSWGQSLKLSFKVYSTEDIESENVDEITIISDVKDLSDIKEKPDYIGFKSNLDKNTFGMFTLRLKAVDGYIDGDGKPQECINVGIGFLGNRWAKNAFKVNEEIAEKIDWTNFQIKLDFIVMSINGESVGEEANVYIDDIGLGSETVPYAYFDGTSMAAPMVTGAVGLLSAYSSSNDLNWTPEEIRTRIIGGAVRENENLVGKSVSDGYLDLGVAISNPNPVLNKLEKNENNQVTISGYFFGENGELKIGGKKANVLLWSDNKITAELPSGVSGGNHDFVVTTGDKYGRNVFNLGKLENEFETLPSFSIDGDFANLGLVECGNNLYNFALVENLQTDKLDLEIRKYDVDNQQWTKQDINLPEDYSIVSGNLVAIEGKIYVILYNKSLDNYSFGAYDPNSNEWGIKSLYIDAYAINFAEAVYYKDKIWISFFEMDVDQGLEIKLYSIDIEKGKAVQEILLDNVSSYDTLPSMGVVDDKLYMFGGLINNEVGNVKIFDGEKWTEGANFPEVLPNQDLSYASGVLDNGFIVTGVITTENKDTYFYDISRDEWKDVDKTLNSDKLFTLDGTYFDGYMYVLGTDHDGNVVFKRTDINKYNKPGWEEKLGEWYYYNENGVMVKNNWVQNWDSKWYYMGSDGAMSTNSWVQNWDGKWYYMGSNGAMLTNSWVQNWDGKWYYMGSDGVMFTNSWVQNWDGKWYYMGSDGAMFKNSWVQNWDSKWYYMGSDGAMLTNTWVDIYYLDFTGAWVSNTSQLRQNIVDTALSQVGSLPYYYGGKPISGGIPIMTNRGQAGNTTSIPDHIGRTIAGLDCFGFCQWVYWNTIGSNVMPEGSEYTTTTVYNSTSCGNLTRLSSASDLKLGDLGFKPGHVGIFAGVNESGQLMWIHCTGNGIDTVVYGTYDDFTRYYKLSSLQ